MRLIDADALLKDINDSLDEMTNIGIVVDGDWLWAKLYDAIENASIIESKQQWIKEAKTNCVSKEKKNKEPIREFMVHYSEKDIDPEQLWIPKACKGCNNHPSNGGSGICACSLASIINNNNICF